MPFHFVDTNKINAHYTVCGWLVCVCVCRGQVQIAQWNDEKIFIRNKQLKMPQILYRRRNLPPIDCVNINIWCEIIGINARVILTASNMRHSLKNAA